MVFINHRTNREAEEHTDVRRHIPRDCEPFPLSNALAIASNSGLLTKALHSVKYSVIFCFS